MKKLMNRSDTMVVEMCGGMVLAHPELELIQKYKVLQKKNEIPKKYA